MREWVKMRAAGYKPYMRGDKLMWALPGADKFDDECDGTIWWEE